jgi:hypothetical protein
MEFDFNKLNRPANGTEALENRVSAPKIGEYYPNYKSNTTYSNSNTVEIKETIKFDYDKPDFTLIPQEALLEIAIVFSKGAQKYGVFNYSHGTKYRRYIAAAMRHLNQWLRGEDIDEIGTNHLANAAASIMMILDSQKTNKGVDDRNVVYKTKTND